MSDRIRGGQIAFPEKCCVLRADWYGGREGVKVALCEEDVGWFMEFGLVWFRGTACRVSN